LGVVILLFENKKEERKGGGGGGGEEGIDFEGCTDDVVEHYRSKFAA